MGRAILSPFADNAAVAATASVVGASALAEFPVDYLVDGDPANACRLDDVTALILLDLGSAVHVSYAAMGHHNLDPALAVAWRGYSSPPATVGASYGITVPVTVGALEKDGYRPNLWADVDAVNPSASYRYWGWAITGTNSADINVGEIWASLTRRYLPGDLRPGAQDGPSVTTITQRTYGGVEFTVKQAPRVGAWSGQIVAANSLLADLVNAFLQGGGDAQPVLFIPNDTLPEVVFARVGQNGLAYDRVGPSLSRMSVSLRELSRGLVWP